MRFSIFISKRIVKNEASSFSRLIVFIARIAIALSLAIMIISASMVGGFRKTISENIYGFWGHISISKESLRNSYDDLPIYRSATFVSEMYVIDGIESVQEYARKAGMIKTKSQIEGIIVKGIGTDFNWGHFDKYIMSGNHFSLNDSAASQEIILSETTTERLNYIIGDSVILHFIDQDKSGDYQQRFRKLKLIGIYKTGLEEFDKLFALIDIKHVQKLNNWEQNQIGGYEVFINDIQELELMTSEVDKTADPFWAVQNIQELLPSIFAWLNLQKVNERIILILMIIVAIINMITSLLILILERVQMIGILKAFGAKNWTIRSIFLWNGAYIISWGMIWGNILGIVICVIQMQFGILKLPEQSYYVSEVPVYIDVVEIALLNIGTLFICILMLILPSYLVTKIQPVKAIRFN